MSTVLDVFSADAFSLVEMTRSIRRVPVQWGRIGQMGVFGSGRGITGKTALVEIENGRLALIDSAERGGGGDLLAEGQREMHAIPVPHFPRNASVYADEISGVRQFGSASEYETVQSVVTAKLERLKKSHALTREYLYARALHGVVTDPKGRVLFDSFRHFDIKQHTVDFDLADPDSDIQGHCRSVTRHIANSLQGDVMSGVHALCSSEWFDQFISHPRVRSAYDYYMAPGNPLRDDVSRGFLFQGILFEEYAAQSMSSDGAQRRYIDAGAARFFPLGTSETFDLLFAPADWLETVNTVGLDIYAAIEPMANRKKGVTVETQSNVLPMCLNPSVLVEGAVMAGLTSAGLSRLVLGPAMAAFAIQVRHYPQTGDPAWRRGIFKADHAILGDGGQVDYSTTAPALGIRDDEWPVLPRMNDRLTIGETAYEIQDIQPDGPNIGRTLILRRCSRNPDKRAI